MVEERNQLLSAMKLNPKCIPKEPFLELFRICFIRLVSIVSFVSVVCFFFRLPADSNLC